MYWYPASYLEKLAVSVDGHVVWPLCDHYALGAGDFILTFGINGRLEQPSKDLKTVHIGT